MTSGQIKNLPLDELEDLVARANAELKERKRVTSEIDKLNNYCERVLRSIDSIKNTYLYEQTDELRDWYDLSLRVKMKLKAEKERGE